MVDSEPVQQVTNKGKPKVFYEGFAYVMQKSLANDTSSFECSTRRKFGCHARLHIKDGRIIKILGKHEHAYPVNECESVAAVNSMKSRAQICTSETTEQVLQNGLSDISEDVLSYLPTTHNLKRRIRRHRAKKITPYINPTSTQDLEIPEEMRKTISGDNFLLYDSGPSRNRILFFGTTTSLSILSKSSTLLGDGTFKITPSLFYQLYTVHALFCGRVIPCVYVLMPDKKLSTYQLVFDKIAELCPGIQPEYFMVDFEMAAIRAIRMSFINTQVKGCFFHFSQCIYRKIQAVGLQSAYKNNSGLNLKMRMIAALAYLPVNKVEDGFEALAGILPDEMNDLVTYFEENFIGIKRRNSRKPPIFNPQMWNMHELIQKDLPRTNNSVEGYHNRLQNAISCSHPTIFKFLKLLQKDHARNTSEIAQTSSGHPQVSQRKIYKDLTLRIKTVLQTSSPEESVISTLERIAVNIRY